MDKEQCVRGFKVFNSDWICNPRPGISKQYTCPGRFQEDGEIKVCGHGMHSVKRRLIASDIMILIQSIELQKWLLVEKLKNLVINAVQMT